jgi:DnaJ domain
MATSEPWPEFDLYAELELHPSASRETIEAAFRALMRRDHPDVSRGNPDARAKRLNIARDWLLDPKHRARYDERYVSGSYAARSRPLGYPDPPKPFDPARVWSPTAVYVAVLAVGLALIVPILTVGIGTNLVTVSGFFLGLVLGAYGGVGLVVGAASRR